MPEKTTVLLTNHPDPVVLAAFGRGDLTPTELAAVAEHVETCAGCTAALSRVADDTLVGLARQAGETPTDPSTIPPIVLPADATDVPPPLADHPRYRILGELGAGGMGVVYKAEHRIMGRTVALKVMAPHLTARADAVERFRREVTAAARLAHPNIVTAHDADEAGGLHFLVMEYVEGVGLDKLVSRRGPLPVSMACQFARQVALGLQHAFEKGMVHRDIKPANLIVSRKGQVKILDFGLARFAREQQDAARPAAATAPNLLMGTPDYLSPEQARNSSAVDTRSDIYSLGGTLYFLLTGSVPFPRATTLIDKLLAHTGEEPTPVQTLRSDVPAELAAVVAKLLAKDPADRFATPADAAAALAPFAKATGSPIPVPTAAPLPAPTPGVIEVAAAAGPAADFAFDTEPGAPTPHGPTVADEPRPRTSRNPNRKPAAVPKPWVAAVVAAVVVVGLVAGVLFREANKKPPGTVSGSPSGSVGKPDAAPPGKANPVVPPGPDKPAGKPKVLYVVPANDLWMPDYTPVRARLEQNGVTVVTASSREGTARGLWAVNKAAVQVPINVVLTPQLDAPEYATVVFCGRDCSEFFPGREGGAAARHVIDRMRAAGKPVAAICTGQGVLVAHGYPRDKPLAYNPWLEEMMPNAGLKWERRRVVTADNVILGADSDAAAEFADALLGVIRSR